MRKPTQKRVGTRNRISVKQKLQCVNSTEAFLFYLGNIKFIKNVLETNHLLAFLPRRFSAKCRQKQTPSFRPAWREEKRKGRMTSKDVRTTFLPFLSKLSFQMAFAAAATLLALTMHAEMCLFHWLCFFASQLLLAVS